MAGVGVGPAAVAVCYHRSVRGREKQDGRMEVDGKHRPVLVRGTMRDPQ